MYMVHAPRNRTAAPTLCHLMNMASTRDHLRVYQGDVGHQILVLQFYVTFSMTFLSSEKRVCDGNQTESADHERE